MPSLSIDDIVWLFQCTSVRETQAQTLADDVLVLIVSDDVTLLCDFQIMNREWCLMERIFKQQYMCSVFEVLRKRVSSLSACV